METNDYYNLKELTLVLLENVKEGSTGEKRGYLEEKGRRIS